MTDGYVQEGSQFQQVSLELPAIGADSADYQTHESSSFSKNFLQIWLILPSIHGILSVV